MSDHWVVMGETTPSSNLAFCLISATHQKLRDCVLHSCDDIKYSVQLFGVPVTNGVSRNTSCYDDKYTHTHNLKSLPANAVAACNLWERTFLSLEHFFLIVG